MPIPLFQKKEFTGLNQNSSISETTWNQGLPAKRAEHVLYRLRSYGLGFLLKIYLGLEISARNTFPHLISISWPPKQPISFFSVPQAITLQFMAIYWGASSFFLPPFIPKKLRVGLETLLPKGSDLEVST